MPRRQAVALGDARLTGRATADGPAFRQQFRPRGAMDRAIDAATAQQGLVRCIDDRIDVQLRDVSGYDLDALHA